MSPWSCLTGSHHSETSSLWGWTLYLCQHHGLEWVRWCWLEDKWGNWGVSKQPLEKGLCEPEIWFSTRQTRGTDLKVCVQNCMRKTRTPTFSFFSDRFYCSSISKHCYILRWISYKILHSMFPDHISLLHLMPYICKQLYFLKHSIICWVMCWKTLLENFKHMQTHIWS